MEASKGSEARKPVPPAGSEQVEVPSPYRGKRILIVINTLRSGGSERFVQIISHRFAELGVDVTVAVFSLERQHYPIDRRVRLIDLGRRTKWDLLRSCLRLRRTIRRTEPEALLAVMTPTIILAILSTLGLSPPPRIVARETVYHSEIHRGVCRLLYALLFMSFFPRCRAIVCPAVEMCDDLSARFGVPMRLLTSIPNPVDEEKCRRLSAEPLTHPFFASPRGAPVIVGCGRLVPQKDYETALRAIQIVNAQWPCFFIGLGEGSERQRLSALCRELQLTGRVDFPGVVPNPFAYMARSDVFVLSSRFEGSPNALVEAMACGIPVVSTDCRSGPKEIITHEATGLLVPVGDHEAMAAAILRLAQDEGLRRRLTHNARLVLRERCHPANVARRYLDVLLSVGKSHALPTESS